MKLTATEKIAIEARLFNLNRDLDMSDTMQKATRRQKQIMAEMNGVLAVVDILGYKVDWQGESDETPILYEKAQ